MRRGKKKGSNIPSTDSHRRLNPDDALRVHDAMGLPDDLHDLVP